MFTWDHRVVRDEEGELVLAEVYYNDGEPYGYSQLPPLTGADIVEETAYRLFCMPVLDVATILAGTEPETIITCVG